MADEQKEVVEKVETKVLTDEEIAKLLADNEELAKKNEEITANLHQVAAERENYKQGLLKAKGKVSTDEEDLDEKIARTVEEKLASSKEAQLLKEKEETIQQLSEKNKELKVALQSRFQVSTLTSGGSQERDLEKIESPKFSEQQLAYFKKKGLDPNKVWENLQKVKGIK